MSSPAVIRSVGESGSVLWSRLSTLFSTLDLDAEDYEHSSAAEAAIDVEKAVSRTNSKRRPFPEDFLVRGLESIETQGVNWDSETVADELREVS